MSWNKAAPCEITRLHGLELDREPLGESNPSRPCSGFPDGTYGPESKSRRIPRLLVERAVLKVSAEGYCACDTAPTRALVCSLPDEAVCSPDC